MQLLSRLVRDFGSAARAMRRRPGVSFVTVLSVAVGIGATTAVFSVINAVLFRPLPVAHPEQLVELLTTYPGDPRMNGFWSKFYDGYRARNHVFSETMAVSPAQLRVTPDGRSVETEEPIQAAFVSGSFFPALGVQAAAGRVIGYEDDDRRGGSGTVAVISWSYWHRRFAGSAAILNSPFALDDVPVTIVGVAPRGFSGVQTGLAIDVWVPMAMEPLVRRPSALATGNFMVQILARLQPGVSLEQARAEMRVLDRVRTDELAERSHDPQWRRAVLEVEPASAGLSSLREVLATPLWLLMSVAVPLLALMCMNVAGMLFAQSERRRREMAVRSTLGASLGSLTRQLLTESLLLSFLGGIIGLAFAYYGAAALVRSWPIDPRWHLRALDVAVHPDWRVLGFAASLALLTSVLFGLAPAWHALTGDLFPLLRGTSQSADTRSRRWLGQSLVALQVALSLALFSAGSLLVQSLLVLRYSGLGFDRNGVLIMTLDPSRASYPREDLMARYQDLQTRLESMPGVRAAAFSATTPIAGGEASRFVQVEGFNEPSETRRRVSLNLVGPHYFATFGTPILTGRDFASSDAGRPAVAIVNRAFARHYFGDGIAVGRRLSLEGQAQPLEIIGMAGDAKYGDLHRPAPRTVYLLTSQSSRGTPSQLAVRTVGSPLAAASEVRRAVSETVAGVTIARMTTLSDQVDAATRPERLIASLSALVGLLGAGLAMMGLYGMVAYSVVRRTSEIGVRMALGATPTHITRLFLRTAAATTAVGLAGGLSLAWFTTRFASGFLRDLQTGSSTPYAVASLAMIGLLLLAAYFPAQRAAHIDPLEALRRE